MSARPVIVNDDGWKFGHVTNHLGHKRILLLAPGSLVGLLDAGTDLTLALQPESLSGPIRSGCLLVGFQWPLCRFAFGICCRLGVAVNPSDLGWNSLTQPRFDLFAFSLLSLAAVPRLSGSQGLLGMGHT